MDIQDQLSALIAEEIDCLQRLMGILLKENEALTTDDVAAIELTTTAKFEALSEQAELADKRSQLVAAATTTGDAESRLRQIIASCTNAEQLETHLTTMNTLSRECQHKNRVNGRLISQRQQVARGALDVIRQADPDTSTYSGQGMSSNTEHSRSLGKA